MNLLRIDNLRQLELLCEGSTDEAELWRALVIVFACDMTSWHQTPETWSEALSALGSYRYQLRHMVSMNRQPNFADSANQVLLADRVLVDEINFCLTRLEIFDDCSPGQPPEDESREDSKH